MAEITAYLGLEKPVGGEKHSRAMLNRNSDRIEAEAKRQNDGIVRHLEIVRASQSDHPANTFWGPGTLMGMIDAAKSANYSDWVIGAGNDGVRIVKEGIYSANWSITNNHNISIGLWHTISVQADNPTMANNTSLGRSMTHNIPPGDPYFAFAQEFYVPPAGQDLYFRFSCGVANAPIAHRIKITKIQ